VRRRRVERILAGISARFVVGAGALGGGGCAREQQCVPELDPEDVSLPQPQTGEHVAGDEDGVIV
jgi:hypothetical protein